MEAAGRQAGRQAAGRLSRICGNAFSGCLTFREQKRGAGVGRELLGASHPHCARCFGLKKVLLPVNRES